MLLIYVEALFHLFIYIYISNYLFIYLLLTAVPIISAHLN